MSLPSIHEQIAYLSELVTPNRAKRINDVLAQRTKRLTIALENVYQSHNMSAVIRSCDCFGLQDLHIIENDNEFKSNSAVSMGASRWVDLHRHNTMEQNTQACINQLKSEDYKVVALCLDETSVNLDQLPINEKLALFIGTEETGLSDTVLEQADHKVMIPMSGFTQSFNLSVTAALCMYDLTPRIRASADWQLNSIESDKLRLKWLIQSIPNGDKMLSHFIAQSDIK